MAADGKQALERARADRPDLIVLDVGMPGIDGFEVLRRVRADSDVPVIMLTARSEEVDRVVGLTVGADDYVTKPFSPRELAARIKAVLRRGRRPSDDEVLRFPGISIDLGRREVLRDGQPVSLSTLEFDLLAALASAPRRVFTRDQLLQRVWGFDYFGVDRVVDVHIANIRKALGDDAADPADHRHGARRGLPLPPVPLMKRFTGSLRFRLVLSHLFVVVVAVVATALLSRSLAGSFFEGHLADMGRDPAFGGMSEVMAGQLRTGFTDSFGRALTIAGLVSAAAAALASGYAAIRVLRPLEGVRRAARRLASGFYAERVPVPAESELAALARRRERPRRGPGEGGGAPRAAHQRGGPRAAHPAHHHPGVHGGPARRGVRAGRGDLRRHRPGGRPAQAAGRRPQHPVPGRGGHRWNWSPPPWTSGLSPPKPPNACARSSRAATWPWWCGGRRPAGRRRPGPPGPGVHQHRGQRPHPHPAGRAGGGGRDGGGATPRW